MESGPTQAVLPLVGLAAEKVIRDRYNWDVVLGQMIAPTIRETRTEEDFAWHIHQTIETDPEAGLLRPERRPGG
ncbi:MAG: hypothetical protein ACQESR_28470 [Planctomycetota bacterium]